MALGEHRLEQVPPSYRSLTAIKINDLFFLESKDKQTILRDLQIGFFADSAENVPVPDKSAKNYFKDQKGISKCRARFKSEIKLGRMIGGRGWTQKIVKNFLGRSFYKIPCGAVPKNGDPLGRIIHDYSFPSATLGSVNAALINTSVQYISFVERARQLSKVKWYIKVDMKNGYRQLGVHPSE